MKVGILGAGGRMGRRLVAAAVDAKLEVGAAIERAGSPDLGADAGALAGVANLGVKIGDDLAAALKKCDVVIDFTAPQATQANAERCAKAGVAMVVGTTGLEGAPMDALKSAARKISIVQSANFSLGVNALLAVVSDLAKTLPGYDVEIVEIHHRKKADAPSGTALRLADAVGRSKRVTGRAGQVGTRTDEELGVLAVRGGDVVGDHTVYFLGPGERIEVTHRAHSRDTFAAGAVRAAQWVAGKKPGLYDMRDVLGFSR